MKSLKLWFLVPLSLMSVGCSNGLFGGGDSSPTTSTAASTAAMMPSYGQAGYDTSVNSKCSHNPYLQQYGCSIDTIEVAAQKGDADAQYALGYMYYYGIDTVHDVPTARLWMKRAASQGQPLAKKALRLVDSGGSLRTLHGSQRYNVDELNKKHDKSVDSVLPRYGKGAATGDNTSVKTNESVSPPLSQKKALPGNIEQQQLQKNTLVQANHHLTVTSPSAGSSNLSEVSGMPVDSVLLNIPSDHYTLQLMGGRNYDKLSRFITEHKLQKEVWLYEASYRGEPWYMLIYGNYPTATQAHTAMQHVSESLQTLKPWIKSFTEVRREIKSGAVS